MTDFHALSAAPAWQERAAATVRRLPLRRHAGGRGLDKDAIVASGWFHGVGECLEVLTAIVGGNLVSGGAFGGPWPLLARDGWLVAPALPVAVGTTPVVGTDAEYSQREPGVWREAAGLEELIIATDGRGPVPGGAFDLLWFGDNERYVVHGGALEVEDLFAVVRVPATPALLDRMLLRARRVEEDLLHGLRWADDAFPAEIEVRRSSALSSEERWRDARLVLETRTDVRSAQQRSDEVAAETEHGDEVVFALEEGREGWRLDLREGTYPFTALALRRRGEMLCLRATLDSAVDPLAQGMRGRLAFDLRSDLVALG
ncbi:MAG: hypothetical protein KAJ97_00105 [Acidobacteria bacterium]|nr:hypothetical protein [Acidobacteriota bacterium]